MLNLNPRNPMREVNAMRARHAFTHFTDYVRWRARTISLRAWAKRSMSSLLVMAVVVLFESGCGAREMEMNVVVFNYWPRALADVYVNGQHVGAGYESNGGGSSISCCYAIRPGAIKVGWMLDGRADDPQTGKAMSAVAELKEIKPGAQYLGVYLYPDGTVALDTAKGIPDDIRPADRK